jgi:hypothetical protein
VVSATGGAVVATGARPAVGAAAQL